jgi:protease-4
MSADHVQAYPSTITGSIGVIALGFNLSGLMDKLGVQYQTFTTGSFKDAGSPFRAMTEAERTQLASVTQDLFQDFLGVVQRGRPRLARAEIERLADGRIYSARQALSLGLIDAIGDLPESVEVAKRAAGISGDARVIVYHRPGQHPDNLFSAQSVAGAPEASASFLESLGEPSFLYWWPGAGAGPLTGALPPAQPPLALPQ